MKRHTWTAIWMAGAAVTLAAGLPRRPPAELSAAATKMLVESLDHAARHVEHVWRDTPPFAGESRVNVYVEIPRGERLKFEFDMRSNARGIDRVIPEDVGGYPVNYGFVPQTVSYDGDPFDALVLGPPLPGGAIARGSIVGLMLMEDHTGLDSKVVLSPAGDDGRPAFALDDGERRRIADFFTRYRRHEPDRFARVPGWGTSADGRGHVEMTHAFFRQCRERTGEPCRIER